MKKQALAIMMLIGAATAAYAAEGWETVLTVACKSAENNLALGQKLDATDGRDGMYDVPPMPGGDLSASFADADGTLWRDIRSFDGKKIWNLRVESPFKGETVQITWKPDTLPTDAVLIDGETGKKIDMKSQAKYSYVNAGVQNLSIETGR